MSTEPLSKRLRAIYTCNGQQPLHEYDAAWIAEVAALESRANIPFVLANDTIAQAYVREHEELKKRYEELSAKFATFREKNTIGIEEVRVLRNEARQGALAEANLAEIKVRLQTLLGLGGTANIARIIQAVEKLVTKGPS